jgi:Domain of unknown function (DUF397)
MGGAVDLSDVHWRKSSFSGNNSNGCVEVAFLPEGTVAVRDTKDRSLPPHRYTTAAWTALLAAVRAGEFDHA